jgi:hypothetical protein
LASAKSTHLNNTLFPLNINVSRAVRVGFFGSFDDKVTTATFAPILFGANVTSLYKRGRDRWLARIRIAPVAGVRSQDSGDERSLYFLKRIC